LDLIIAWEASEASFLVGRRGISFMLLDLEHVAITNQSFIHQHIRKIIMKIFVTIFLSLLLMMSFSTTASAQLFTEDFNYTALDSLTLHSWLISSGGTTNAIRTVSPGLTFGGYASSGVGNAVALTNNGQDAFRSFPKDSGNTVYSAFMINVSAAQAAGDYFYGLSPAESQTNYYGRLFIKSSGAGFLFGISKSNETAVYGTTVFSFNTTYLAVVKYSFYGTSTDTNDVITVYALPPATSLTSEPLTAEIVDTAHSRADTKNLGFVTLRQGSATNAPTLTMDGIRIDTTWKGVIGGKVYSIGTGNVTGETYHYASLKAACDSINANANNITENRTYYITSDLTEAANVSIGGNTNGYTITFKPYTGVTPTITFAQVADNVGLSGGWVIGLKNLTTTSATNYGATQNDSTQNIVIDGSNTAGGMTRDLTLKTDVGVSGNTNVIRIWGNANNIVIKNIVAATGQSVSYAILITVRNSAVVGYLGDFVPDNIVIDNCDVTNTFGSAGQGIAISNSGTPTAFPIGIVFSNNKITARTRGILLNNAGNTDVIGNKISVTQTSTGNLSEGIFALAIGTSTSVTNIVSNNIQILSTANVTAGSYGIEGIQISSQGVYNVFNNVVTGFVFPNLAQGLFLGIDVTSATTNPITANIFNNSVYMANGSNTIGATPPTQTAFNLNLSGASGTRTVNVMNNIFANFEGDYATQAIRVASTNTATLLSNYNNLYSAGGSGTVGIFGATACATLADWKTASSQDANSVSGDPGFVSATDLHINPTVFPASVVSNAGTPIGMVTTDIDGDLRSVSTPDIGADEYVASPIAPAAGFTFSKTSISYGSVWKDSTKNDSVIVTNVDKVSKLSVDSVRSTNPLFTVLPVSAINVDTSASRTFVITFAPKAKGAQSGLIVFYNNGPRLRDTVQVTGTGKIKEPLFTATPASMNFGSILSGTTKKDSVTVKNTGTDSLFITAVASSNARFTVTPASARMDSNASRKFYITFAPTSVGGQSTFIVFTTNTAEVYDTVKVVGNGVAGVTIAEARKDLNNDLIPDHSVTKDTLVVYGVVTAPDFSLTQTSYFIQDSTGGINLFSYTITTPALAKGDSVMVIGIVAQYRGLTEFTPLTVDTTNLKVLKHNVIVPKAKRLTLKDFVANAESYEGQLIEVDTLFKASGTWPAAGGYSSIFVTNQSTSDTSQMFINAATPIGGTTEPLYPINVVGVVSQYSSGATVYNNGYEIMPRDTNDIKHITVMGVNDALAGIPTVYSLQNNYPNPFNPSTTIMYGLPQQSHVTVMIYSVLGQEVATLVNEVQAPSYYRAVWNGQDKKGGQVSSGVYFFRIVAQSTDGKAQPFVQVKKMMLMK
jgi:hypothetical protein